MLMGPVGGRFGDVRGRRRAAECGLAVAIVALATLAVSGSTAHAAVIIGVLAVFGIGFGFAQPSLITAAIESVPERRAGTASGVFAASRYSGSIPASIAFSIVVGTGTAGVDGLLVVSVMTVLVAIAAARSLPHRLAGAVDPDVEPL